MKRTRIKICGICNIEDAKVSVESGCDALGLNFYRQSPRFLSVAEAIEICAELPVFVCKVGLFVNPSHDEVRNIIDKVNLDVLQFHGEEPQEFCAQFGKPFIKVISVKSTDNQSTIFENAQKYPQASSILLDTFDEVLVGGSGNNFNWDLIPENLRSRIILAGGLSPVNVAKAIKLVKPYAVDVSSGVGFDGGDKRRKDEQLIKEFVRQVNEADFELNQTCKK